MPERPTKETETLQLLHWTNGIVDQSWSRTPSFGVMQEAWKHFTSICQTTLIMKQQWHALSFCSTGRADTLEMHLRLPIVQQHSGQVKSAAC